ncbi:hypothetical protein M0765_000560 [Variovorax sp. S2]|uniref:hypothetical protein n=1 Tax=Variovorax sp. S12S4 TaxID=3029170 RepID=UPI00215BACF9|nr:hypothetical protein [Variovorax sp. S12S4]MCR8956273.1 hypothetical protein [Variovorax sp. S12S4]
MKRLAVAALLAFQLAGCATHSPRCPLLPEPPARPTAQQLDAYTAQLVRLYGQCAGGTP